MTSTKKRVLVIEDEQLTRQALVDELQNEGFEVLLAESGDEGIKIAREKLPNLILLDILLPKISGIEICKRMKADAAIKHIPVIFFTSIDTPKSLINYTGYGAIDYLHKSIPPELLIEQVRVAIGIL